MNPKVSIIVPVYNVEMYLPRCLDSLHRQSLEEIEILLIDDGSPDGSGRIADEYAEKDGRFRVIHQANAGVAAARNRGIELAQAPYLMFVDSDDWVEPDFCRIPYEMAARERVDMVMFRYVSEGASVHETSSPSIGEQLISREEAMELLYSRSGVFVWNKLYCKSLFADVRYPEGRTYEDHGTTHRLVQKAECVLTTDAVLYHYFIREDSICHSHTKRKIQDMIQMQLMEADDLKTYGYSDIAEELKHRVALRYLMFFGLRAERSDEYLRLLRDKRKADSYSLKGKRLLLVLRFSPLLFDLICILSGKRRWKRT